MDWELFFADYVLRAGYVLLVLCVSSAMFFVLRTLTKTIVETVAVFAFLALSVILGLWLENNTLLIIGGIGTYVWLIVTSFMQKNTTAYVSLAGVFILLVTFIICYSAAGDDLTPKAMSLGVTRPVSKFIGGIINTTIVLMGMATLAGFSASVYTMLKR